MTKRIWKKVNGGLFDLLKIVQDAGGVTQTVKDGKRKMGEILQSESIESPGGYKEMWGPYSSRIQDVMEVVEFQDGSMLMNITVSEFAGTFATHDDIRVEWWYGVKK